MADIPHNGKEVKGSSILHWIKDIIIIVSLIGGIAMIFNWLGDVKTDIAVLKALFNQKTGAIEKDMTRIEARVDRLENK